MSLVTLAVVSDENAPLYLRDFQNEQSTNMSGEVMMDEDEGEKRIETEDTDDDPFGLFERKSSKPNDSCSLRHQIIINSALDSLDELISPKSMKLRPMVGANSMYIGLLGDFDEFKVYGYNTSTKTKFIATVADVMQDENQQLIREAGLKALFANIHELYVEYMLNPFSSIRGNQKINSARFDHGVGELVTIFNETYGKKNMTMSLI